jgi:hypothetical protein
MHRDRAAYPPRTLFRRLALTSETEDPTSGTQQPRATGRPRSTQRPALCVQRRVCGARKPSVVVPRRSPILVAAVTQLVNHRTRRTGDVYGRSPSPPPADNWFDAWRDVGWGQPGRRPKRRALELLAAKDLVPSGSAFLSARRQLRQHRHGPRLRARPPPGLPASRTGAGTRLLPAQEQELARAILAAFDLD